MIFYNKNSNSMDEMLNESVSLVITSPPYPMIAKWDEEFGTTDFNSQHKKLEKSFNECKRVLIKGGIICINIGDATRSMDPYGFCCFPNIARITMYMWENGFTPLIPIYWRKISNRPNAFLGSGFLPPNAYVSQDSEIIAIFRKGNLRKFPPKDKNRYDSAYTKAERDLWFSQVWNIQGARGAKDDSSFPDEIPYRLIRMFSVIGDRILDPFCGKGSVMMIADENGRIGIGYDIVDYISKPRLRPRR